MRGPRVIQIVAGIVIVSVGAFAFIRRNEIGPKGTPVSLDSIALCLVASAVVAFVVTRVWHWLPAPFIAGIVGVFFGGHLGPVGGIIGVLVGAAVAVAVTAESRLTNHCS